MLKSQSRFVVVAGRLSVALVGIVGIQIRNGAFAEFEPFILLFDTALLAVLLLVWSYAFYGRRAIVLWTAIGAVTVGATGFVAGYVGPLIVTPGALRGPLLGIFVTGPLGVVVGAFAGALYGIWREHIHAGSLGR